MPTVSVVLNTFNRCASLQKALASVLAQTYQDFEVIVVDDGSTDGTADVVAHNVGPRVRYTQHTNMGLAASRNVGARQSTGPWLAFLDDDDTVDPSWLEELVKLTSDDTGIVYCGYTLRDESGACIGTGTPQPLGPILANAPGSYLPGSWIMRREIFDRCGEYLDGLPYIHQFELLLRAHTVCYELGLKVKALDRCLFNYTSRKPSSRPMQWPRLAYDGGRWILARHAAAYAGDRMAAANHHGVVGVAAAQSGVLRHARRHLWRSLRAQPTSGVRYLRLAASVTPWSARLAWGRGSQASGQGPPLPRVHELPAAHRRAEDHYFLPWRYQRNPQLSSDGHGTPYWHDPLRNSTLYQEPVYRKARRLARQSSVRAVLDVGTGSGVKLERLVAPMVETVVGIDQGSGIAIARRRTPTIEWLEGDLLDPATWTSFEGRTFDLIICADVIEHVEDPVGLLRHITRQMSPGSRLLISTPDRLRADRRWDGGPPPNERHVREWSADEFELLLESMSLVVSKRYHLLPRGYRATLLEAKRLAWRLLHAMALPDKRSNMAFLCTVSPGRS